MLELTADRPRAIVAVRLCDVAPDGRRCSISRGVLNLTHRESHEHPTPVPVGERLVVRVDLRVLGQAVPAGHRLRLAVAPGYWPWAWPSPEPVALTLHTAGESRLELPVRAPRRRRCHVARLRATQTGPGTAARRAARLVPARGILTREIASGRSELQFFQDRPAVRVRRTGRRSRS